MNYEELTSMESHGSHPIGIKILVAGLPKKDNSDLRYAANDAMQLVEQALIRQLNAECPDRKAANAAERQ